MQGKNIHKLMMIFFLFLLVGIFFGCATNIQVKMLEKEIQQLREVVLNATKELKDCNKLTAQNVKQSEAAASRAEKAATKAESAANKAERSVELFLYEDRVKLP